MIQFWLAAIGLLLLGFALLIPPLFAKSKPRTDRARLNLDLHKQRQQELANEGASPDELARLAAESERNLLSDLEAAQTQGPPPEAGGKLAVSMALPAILAFGLFAYVVMGRPDLVGNVPTAVQQAEGGAPANMEEGIRRLSERLKANPNDLQGWVLLGRSLQSVGEGEKALQAYEYALKLAPDNLDVKAIYAQALLEARKDVVKAGEIIAEILKADPNSQGGLWVAGILALEHKEPAKAVDYWTKLKAALPVDSDEARQVESFIAQAQGKPIPAPAASGQRAAQGPSGAEKPAGGGKRIRVKVSLADSVKAKANPEDALFIFARAAEGPPMPLAVVRKQAKDLPAEVVLDDSMAMMQGMNLSSFERIIVGARISKSGKPTPGPGDLQGITQPVTPGKDAEYSVVVDQEVGAGGR